jgi:hypothetical protein
MSEFVKFVQDTLLTSKFNFLDAKTLEVENAVIIWPNFSGKPNRFGNTAKYFNLAITKEVADELSKRNFNVHEMTDKETNEILFYFVNIKVNMESAYPPIITVYTNYRGVKSHTSISADTVATLDNIQIESADCMINIYCSKANPDRPSGYLKKLNIIQHKVVEFDGKYDNWDGPADAGQPEPDEPAPEVSVAPAASDTKKMNDTHDYFSKENVDGADSPDKPAEKKSKDTAKK